jgi:hypothetical protein
MPLLSVVVKPRVNLSLIAPIGSDPSLFQAFPPQLIATPPSPSLFQPIQPERLRPPLPRGTPREVRRAFRSAFDRDAEILTNRPACADLYGGQEPALNILYNTTYRFVPTPGGDPRREAGQPVVIGGQTITTVVDRQEASR